MIAGSSLGYSLLEPWMASPVSCHSRPESLKFVARARLTSAQLTFYMHTTTHIPTSGCSSSAVILLQHCCAAPSCLTPGPRRPAPLPTLAGDTGQRQGTPPLATPLHHCHRGSQLDSSALPRTRTDYASAAATLACPGAAGVSRVATCTTCR